MHYVQDIICALRNGLLSRYVRGREIYRTPHLFQRPESHFPDRLSGTVQKDQISYLNGYPIGQKSDESLIRVA
jgi:hypothetical protein